MVVLWDIFVAYGWHGLSIVLSIFLVYKHYLEPRQKKKKGTYQSWDVMNERLDNQSVRISTNQNNCDIRNDEYNKFMEKEIEEGLRMERMEADLESLRDKSEIQDNHIFSQLASLHSKFDNLMVTLVKDRLK